MTELTAFLDAALDADLDIVGTVDPRWPDGAVAAFYEAVAALLERTGDSTALRHRPPRALLQLLRLRTADDLVDLIERIRAEERLWAVRELQRAIEP